MSICFHRYSYTLFIIHKDTANAAKCRTAILYIFDFVADLHLKRPTHWQLDSVPLRAMPASDVIAAFKKFDKNGDGVISKSELVDASWH